MASSRGKFRSNPFRHGLRRSDELCQAHDLAYDVTVRTAEQTTAESVDEIVSALRRTSPLPSF
jgi:hypothetical protein